MIDMEIKLIKKYKYISFKRQTENFSGKPMFECINNKSGKVLANIFWYSQWKQYCFTQTSENIVFDKTCLNDVIDFINYANSEFGENRNGKH